MLFIGLNVALNHKILKHKTLKCLTINIFFFKQVLSREQWGICIGRSLSNRHDFEIFYGRGTQYLHHDNQTATETTTKNETNSQTTNFCQPH